MRIVVVTGMSGGGKSTALKMLEDMGYYCVDNLPAFLIEKFIELINLPGNQVQKVAMGLDVRSGQSFEDADLVIGKLRQAGYQIEILFMDAAENILIKRYKETRRVHPLSMEGRVEEGVRDERKILEKIRHSADYIIDTTNLLTRELKEELERIFIMDQEYNSLMVTVMSFGFKYGIPADADLVFDVRFLPNPFYIEELKSKTGNEKEVRDFVMHCDEAEIFRDKLSDMIRFLIPNYVKEGKNRLVIAIGCTGGKHRSVTFANALYQDIKGHAACGLKLYHRDIKA